VRCSGHHLTAAITAAKHQLIALNSKCFSTELLCVIMINRNSPTPALVFRRPYKLVPCLHDSIAVIAHTLHGKRLLLCLRYAYHMWLLFLM